MESPTQWTWVWASSGSWWWTGKPGVLQSASHSVMNDSLQSHGLQPIRLLCPWDFPSKDTGVGCHFLLQGIFPTQGSNPGLLHCRQILYWLSYKGSPCCSLCGHKELDTTKWLSWFFFFLKKVQLKHKFGYDTLQGFSSRIASSAGMSVHSKSNTIIWCFAFQ